MRGHLVKVVLGSVLLTVGIAANCASVTKETTATVPVETANGLGRITLTPTPAPMHNPVLDPDELAALKKFAESYQPKSGREVIPSPPVLDEKTSQIITKAANSNSREHEKFVVLIFLRLSRFQIEHFKQRYELGRSNPLTKEFYRLIGWNDFETREINLAYLADDYVEKNPELRQYGLIDAEMRRIGKAGERIKKELDKTIERQSRTTSPKT